MMYKYSILKYNIGVYTPHPQEVNNPSDICEYVYVTDDPNFRSNTWKVVTVKNPFPEDPFWMCYYIRFHPFDFVSTDIVIRIDGGVFIPDGKKVDELYNRYIAAGCDMALGLHFEYNEYRTELEQWMSWRGYPERQYKKLDNLFVSAGFGPEYKGLIAMTICIQSKTMGTDYFNNRTFEVLTKLADKEAGKQVERNDQVVATYVMDKYVGEDIAVKFMDWSVWNRDYFHWMWHTGERIGYDDMKIPKMFFNRELTQEDMI